MGEREVDENDAWTIAFRALSAFPGTACAMFREAGFTQEDLKRQAQHELCSRGDTLLTRAARLGHLGAARTLLDLDADLEWPTRATDLSPLQVACHCGHAELVSFFLARGASITRRNNRGLSAVSTAVHTMDVRCLDILANAGADLGSRGLQRGNTLAQSAASRGNINALAYLAQRGVNLFERDYRGLSSLEAAAKQRNSVNGAQPNATLDFLHEVLRVGGSAASVAWSKHVRANRRLPLVALRALVVRGRAVPRAPLRPEDRNSRLRRVLIFLTSAYSNDAPADAVNVKVEKIPMPGGIQMPRPPPPKKVHHAPRSPAAHCTTGPFRHVVSFL